MKNLCRGKIAGILTLFLFLFPVRFAMAGGNGNDAETVEVEVTVSTIGDPYIATAFNEDIYGLDWTTSDTKTLVIILSAPTGKEIKVTSIVTEDANWGPQTPSQWDQSHTYTASEIKSTDDLQTLFIGLIKDKEPVPGIENDDQPPPEEWKAGVVHADLRADANNTGTNINEHGQRLPATDPEERAREKVAARAGADNPTGLIVPLNRGHHQGEEEEDYLVPGINTEDPDLVKAKLVLNMHDEVEKNSKIKFFYNDANLKVYKGNDLIQPERTYYVVDVVNNEEPFGKNNLLYVEGVGPSSNSGGDHIRVELIPGREHKRSRDRVKLTVMRVDITDAEDNVLNEDQTTIVGKKIDLKSKITPEDIVVEQHQWTIIGNTVKNYEQSLSSGTKTDLAGHLNDEAVEFYWIAGYNEVDVKYEAGIGGISFDSIVKYEVKRPTAKLISNITELAPPIDVRWWIDGHQWLVFGIPLVDDDIYLPGITWEAEVTTPENGAGEIAFTQLTRFEFTKTLDDGTPKIRSSCGNWVLDEGEGIQYAGAKSIGSDDIQTLNRNDPPRIKVTGNKKVGMNHRFHVYLMYKPSGEDSIWVTLRRLDQWRVEASATKENDTWGVDEEPSPFPPDNENPPGSYDSDDLPTWDSNTSDYQWEVVD